MGTMMNGYHYDRAKDGCNEYSVLVDGFELISHSNYASALDLFKEKKEQMIDSERKYSVELIKEYDSKQKSYVNEVVKSA